jgi:hypothetical protein
MIRTESGGIEFAYDAERYELMLEVKMMLNRFRGEDLPKLKTLYGRLYEIEEDIARRKKREERIKRRGGTC